jgi:hypothetical protein
MRTNHGLVAVIPILAMIAMMVIIINEGTDDNMIAMWIDVKSSWGLLHRSTQKTTGKGLQAMGFLVRE